VVSSLGKGIAAASLAAILESRGTAPRLPVGSSGLEPAFAFSGARSGSPALPARRPCRACLLRAYGWAGRG